MKQTEHQKYTTNMKRIFSNVMNNMLCIHSLQIVWFFPDFLLLFFGTVVVPDRMVVHCGGGNKGEEHTMNSFGKLESQPKAIQSRALTCARSAETFSMEPNRTIRKTPSKANAISANESHIEIEPKFAPHLSWLPSTVSRSAICVSFAHSVRFDAAHNCLSPSTKHCHRSTSMEKWTKGHRFASFKHFFFPKNLNGNDAQS